jgi:inner membrane protein
MDNLTHSLVGLAASKAGLERLSPAATVMCVIAANAPDADIVTVFSSRWSYLNHHRGITHSIVGTAVLAVLIPILFWLGDRLVAWLARREPKMKLRGLLLASLIVSATHPLLDWTNNYGIRPFLPWNNQWYYGDLVFIIDPWIWLSLGGACFLLTSKSRWQITGWALLAAVLTLIVVLVPMLRPGSVFPIAAQACWLVGIAVVISLHRSRTAFRWGSAIPIAVFALLVTYWGGLAILHRTALSRSETLAATLASDRGEKLNRIAAMPMLANPMRWQCVFETDRATYRFDISLNQTGIQGETKRYEKLHGQQAVRYSIATRDERAKIFLGFARFPVAQVRGDCVSETLVGFADLRYTEPGRSRGGAFTLDVPIECSDLTGDLETK